MCERVIAFLAKTHASDWVQHPLAGDASSRSYRRLKSPTGETAILMNAGNASSAEMEKFTTIADALRAVGLAAPEIYALDAPAGLMLLEDLGSIDIAQAVQQNPDMTLACYNAATDILLKIPQVTDLELPVFSAENAAKWLAPLRDWYGQVPLDITQIQTVLILAFGDLGMKPDTLALRDYHAENLIWRPEKNGLAKVGLLDFQDAVYAPAGYDLASLTRDARRDVAPEITKTLTEKMAHHAGKEVAEFSAQTALLAVQRNLRILGIFASLAKRDGKPQYATLVPRVWRYLLNDLAHPITHWL